MAEDYQELHRKRISRMRSLMDYSMGIILSLIGLFFLFYGQMDITLMGRKHNNMDYLIGGLFLVYGIWRIYRGYKKDYFR
jgi:hypothetical protein